MLRATVGTAIALAAAVCCGEPQKPAAAPKGKVIVTESHRCGYILDKIYFEPGSSSLGDRQDPILDAHAEMFVCELEDCAALRVDVLGHAAAGEAEPAALATARANTVRDALVARKVPAAVIAVESHAADRPVDTSGTDFALAKNRRVEFGIDKAACSN